MVSPETGWFLFRIARTKKETTQKKDTPNRWELRMAPKQIAPPSNLGVSHSPAARLSRGGVGSFVPALRRAEKLRAYPGHFHVRLRSFSVCRHLIKQGFARLWTVKLDFLLHNMTVGVFCASHHSQARLKQSQSKSRQAGW